MKKYLVGIIAVVLAIGVSAFSPEAKKARKGLTTYYSIRTGTAPLSWRWIPQSPIGQSCQGQSGGPTCETVADSQPADDSAPSGLSGFLNKP
jgi:hypothetical protein